MEPATLYSGIAEGPSDGKAYWVRTEDRIRIRVGVWERDGSVSGTVLWFPGRTGYIERYGRLAERMTEFGFASLVVDWRGHGLSERLTDDPNKCHIERYSDYQLDVAAMMTAAGKLNLPKPFYLIGNSMGACIALRALLGGLNVTACAFIAPMWAINLAPFQNYAAWTVSWTAQAIGKSKIFAPGYDGQNYVLKTQFEDNSMTNDPSFYSYWSRQARSQPDLVIGGPTMGWLFQSLTECRKLARMRLPDIPCITFCGDQDEDVDNSFIQKRMANWPSGSFELVQNAKHDILSEILPIRESAIARIYDLFAATGR